jgi:hypothetical protein
MSDSQDPHVAARVAQRIVPTLPPANDVGSDGSRSDDEYTRQETEPSEGGLASNTSLNMHSGAVNYSVLPPPQRIEPVETYEELYEPLEESSEVEDAEATRGVYGYPDHGYDDDDDDEVMSTASGGFYRPAFRPRQSPADGSGQGAPHGRSASPENPLRLPGAFNQTLGGTQSSTNGSAIGREGQNSTSAIVIQDSPTPPLRPLASPKARLAASITGRCPALEDTEASVNETVEEKKITLGELVCPICLGPPSPLVITECGHTL